jgi:hypothetical protein
MIDPGHPRLSIVRQCELVPIGRSWFYRGPMPESDENLVLMRLIDEQFLETPWYGSRQMARHLRRNGGCIGRHRVRRLMTRMGLAPIYQRPKTSEPHPRHKIYPYLLRHLAIERPTQVWCADSTYIQMRRGFLDLVPFLFLCRRLDRQDALERLACRRWCQVPPVPGNTASTLREPPGVLITIRRRAASLRRIKTMAAAIVVLGFIVTVLWWILLVSVAMKVIMG